MAARSAGALALLVLLGMAAASTDPAKAQPEACGPVGAAAFASEAPPPPFALPPGPADLLVSAPGDAVDGDTASPASLRASPGPDGISLREALQAAKGAGGPVRIAFDPRLAGAAVAVARDLPPLDGPPVTLTGDVDGDGAADVTLRADPAWRPRSALVLASGGHVVHALRLEGFGVHLHGGPRGGVHEGATVAGVLADSPIALLPAGAQGGPADVWRNVTLADNRIRTPGSALTVSAGAVQGARIEGLRVTGNTLEDGGLGLAVGFGAAGRDNVLAGADIAHNRVKGGDLSLVAGMAGASRNAIEGVRIAHNVVEGAGFGVVVIAGDASSAYDDPKAPVVFPHANTVRDVRILGNTIAAPRNEGIQVALGGGPPGGSRIEGVTIEGNRITGGPDKGPQHGIYLSVFSSPRHEGAGPLNAMADVVVRANDVRVPSLDGRDTAAAVTILPGEGQDAGVIRNVTVANNVVERPPSFTGIAVIGADATSPVLPGSTPQAGARNSVASQVAILCNRIAPFSEARPGIRLTGGQGGPVRDNRVEDVRVADNAEGPALDRVEMAENAAGAEGNRLLRISIKEHPKGDPAPKAKPSGPPPAGPPPAPAPPGGPDASPVAPGDAPPGPPAARAVPLGPGAAVALLAALAVRRCTQSA